MIKSVFIKAFLSGLSLLLFATASHAQSFSDVLIDMATGNGTTTVDGSGRSWNTVAGASQPTLATPMPLIDESGNASGLTLAISSTEGPDSFNPGENLLGVAPIGEAAARGYPATATEDNLYGYTTSQSGFPTPTGPVTLTLSGFTPGQSYDFYGFASRNGATDNRTEDISFQGAGSPVTVVYDPVASVNTGDIFSSGYLNADNTGTISLTFSPDAANTNPEQFFYLGVLEVVPAAPVPEPSSLGLAGLGMGAAGVAGFLRRRMNRA